MSAKVCISDTHADVLDELEQRTGIRRYKLVGLVLDFVLRDGADGFAARLKEAGLGAEGMRFGELDLTKIGIAGLGFGGKDGEEVAG
jgi:hypothetical protein